MGMGTSNFVIRWINFLTMLLAIAVVIFGVWMSTHHDGCRKSLTVPVLGLGAFVFVIGNPGIHGVGLNNTDNWKRLKSCLVKSEDCNNLAKRYKTLKQYKIAKLTPIEAGCCRPPSECGYPVVNDSYYDLSFHPVSSNKDCKLYKNTRAVKCYNCDSCKAGVGQYMKTEWRVVAIFNSTLFIVLPIIYFVGCCARRNAGQTRVSKV
ncbi:Tetraspanin-10 [Hibiscus syriacus]|uniref:Tetraspanin-10 n=1 Tax=Hibiscus syriacus TaxID=106335 RepID=A0A6A3BQ26_HIBSY|nr:Tetraspanin-10 [Hibiscus syriacus]